MDPAEKKRNSTTDHDHSKRLRHG